MLMQNKFQKMFSPQAGIIFAGLRFLTAVPPELQITTFPAAA